MPVSPRANRVQASDSDPGEAQAPPGPPGDCRPPAIAARWAFTAGRVVLSEGSPIARRSVVGGAEARPPRGRDFAAVRAPP